MKKKIDFWFLIAAAAAGIIIFLVSSVFSQNGLAWIRALIDPMLQAEQDSFVSDDLKPNSAGSL